MLKIILSPAAASELDEIWWYIAQDNIRAADGLLSTINKKFNFLAEFPLSGTDKSYLRPGLRNFQVDNYLLFYRRNNSSIEITRILHSARDINNLI